MQSLAPVIKDGLDIWLNSLLPVFGAGCFISVITAIGIYRRTNWYIGFVFSYGCLLLAAYICGLCLGVAILLRLVAPLSPELHFLSYVNVIEWLMTALIAWLLLRTLRLAYWQPWTSQQEWEQAEKLGPPRTLLAMWIARKK